MVNWRRVVARSLLLSPFVALALIFGVWCVLLLVNFVHYLPICEGVDTSGLSGIYLNPPREVSDLIGCSYNQFFKGLFLALFGGSSVVLVGWWSLKHSGWLGS